MFFLIDPTHTIKNIYNNFQRNEKMIVPENPLSNKLYPNFSHIRQLYQIESASHIRMAHKLNKIVLDPTNIQRSSAKLALAVFHESTVSALEYFVYIQGKPWEDTLNFVKLITNLWKILNVKSSNIGTHKLDPLRCPINSEDDSKLHLLKSYEDLFGNWRSSGSGLSIQTINASHLLCTCLRELSIHLMRDQGFRYVLLGQIQSDPIEKRFGTYRQMSGSNFLWD